MANQTIFEMFSFDDRSTWHHLNNISSFNNENNILSNLFFFCKKNNNIQLSSFTTRHINISCTTMVDGGQQQWENIIKKINHMKKHLENLVNFVIPSGWGLSRREKSKREREREREKSNRTTMLIMDR